MKKIKCILAGITAVLLLSACSVTIHTNTDKPKENEVNPPVKEEVAVPETEGKTAEQVVDVSEDVPFWGVWCYASKKESDAENFAEELSGKGLDAKVFTTSDWSNLNSETYYAVSAGTYMSEEDAKAALDSVVAKGYEDAYVKYSGELR